MNKKYLQENWDEVSRVFQNCSLSFLFHCNFSNYFCVQKTFQIIPVYNHFIKEHYITCYMLPNANSCMQYDLHGGECMDWWTFRSFHTSWLIGKTTKREPSRGATKKDLKKNAGESSVKSDRIIQLLDVQYRQYWFLLYSVKLSVNAKLTHSCYACPFYSC